MFELTEADIARLEQGKRDSAYFHTMRKHTHSRAHRQAAWRKHQNYLDFKAHLQIRAHPIAPRWQWFDWNDTSPKGWTYPGDRTLSNEEVDLFYPGARELTPYPSRPHRYVCDFFNGLRLSVPLGSPGWCARWLPELKLWRVYSKAVRQKPYRVLSPEE